MLYNFSVSGGPVQLQKSVTKNMILICKKALTLLLFYTAGRGAAATYGS
jgi:hypothetical protein